MTTYTGYLVTGAMGVSIGSATVPTPATPPSITTNTTYTGNTIVAGCSIYVASSLTSISVGQIFP